MINTFLRHAARSMGTIFLLWGWTTTANAELSNYCLTSIDYKIEDTEGSWPSGTHIISPPHCDTDKPYVWSKAIADSYWGTRSDVYVRHGASYVKKPADQTYNGVTFLAEWVYTNGARVSGGINNGEDVNPTDTTIPQGSRGNAYVTFKGPAPKVGQYNNLMDETWRVTLLNDYNYTDAYGGQHIDRRVTITATVHASRMNNRISAQVQTPVQSCVARKGHCAVENTLVLNSTDGARIEIKPNPQTSGSVTSCKVDFPGVRYYPNRESFIDDIAGPYPENYKFNVDITTEVGTGQCLINFDLSLL